MPFWIVRNDITRMEVDAVVNAAKPSLLGGGGVDGAIHAAAGPELLEACRALGGCPTGEVRLTPGFRLPAKYVIHTVGPVWQGGSAGERELLRSCYRGALELADELGCGSIAFPLISAGAYGFPKSQAAEIARETIESFLWSHELNVYLVLYGRESLDASRPFFQQIREYIDDRYVAEHPSQLNRPREDYASYAPSYGAPSHSYVPEDRDSVPLTAPSPGGPVKPRRQKDVLPRPARKEKREEAPGPEPYAAAAREDACAVGHAGRNDFGSRFGLLDESFQQMLLRKIDERGMSDAACYKRANIDRKLFSKIRKDVYYKPSKPTALAFAVALELDLGQTEELLEKAGYALSRSSRFDLIVRWFIEREIFDVFLINEALFEFDQALLGNVS